MDLKNLISFIQVAELSSFTRAARALGYSQSTVSSHIRQLETELGSQLFERINHTVVLTQRGREILYYAQQITLLTKEMEDSMREEKSVPGHGRLPVRFALKGSVPGIPQAIPGYYPENHGGRDRGDVQALKPQ